MELWQTDSWDNLQISADTTYVFQLLPMSNLPPTSNIGFQTSFCSKHTEWCKNLKGSITTKLSSNQMVRFAPPLATTSPPYITFNIIDFLDLLNFGHKSICKIKRRKTIFLLE